MKPRLQASRAALDLIERFEGYRRTAARLQDGRWTIGYGHTRTARQGAEVSSADAEALLIYDLMEVSGALNDWVFTPLNQNQFDALSSFVFNIGLDNFRHSSVLRRLNEGALLQAAYAMEMWRKVEFDGEPIVLDALVRRRAAEKALFLTPPGGFLPAPSQVLRPKLDRDVGAHVPASWPVELAAAFEGEEATAERLAEPFPAEPPSASVAAADAITERLQSILNESEAGAPGAEPESPFPAEPEAAEAQAGLPEEAAAEPSMFAPESPPESGAAATRPFHAPADQKLNRAARRPSPVAVWLMALVLGILVFGGGGWLAVQAKGPGAGSLIGLGVALIGIAISAFAVYFLFERLGGREEP